MSLAELPIVKVVPAASRIASSCKTNSFANTSPLALISFDAVIFPVKVCLSPAPLP